MSDIHEERRQEIRANVIGFGAAIALTIAAFGAVYLRMFDAQTTLAIVFALALVQIIVHFRFFLKISFSRSSRDDLVLILFSSLIIVLMVSGTLVVLLNLRERMM